jgi:hypothetical protein
MADLRKLGISVSVATIMLLSITFSIASLSLFPLALVLCRRYAIIPIFFGLASNRFNPADFNFLSYLLFSHDIIVEVGALVYVGASLAIGLKISSTVQARLALPGLGLRHGMLNVLMLPVQCVVLGLIDFRGLD